MDRIDIHLNVPAVDINKLMIGRTESKAEEDTQAIKTRVSEARLIQQKRFANFVGIYCNADMKNVHLNEFALLTSSANLLLKQAVNKFGLSARTYFRLVKVARTIADLSKSVEIGDDHIAEALQYRIRSE